MSGQPMNVDYYALLTKAVAGRDAAARGNIYNDARNLVGNSRLSREAAASHAAALEDAIQRIEGELAAEDARSVADVKAVLSTDRSVRPLVVVASAVLAVIALSALLYGYVMSRGPAGAGATTSSPRAARGAMMPSWRT